jgi:hypothetical protein
MPHQRAKRSAAGILDGSCMDCGVDTRAKDEYYMLKDELWRTINPLVVGMLCLECAEDRLGRPLHRGDFSAAPMNKLFALRCAALAERLQRKRPASGSAGRRKVQPLSLKAIQSRLAKKTRTQSSLGRLSAALLPYRGHSGRVPPGTLTRVLRELTSGDVVHAPAARRTK